MFVSCFFFVREKELLKGKKSIENTSVVFLEIFFYSRWIREILVELFSIGIKKTDGSSEFASMINI